MVEHLFTAHARAAVRARIVAPAKYARVRKIVGEKVAEPVDVVACCLRLLAVSVQAMDGDDTAVLLAAKAQTSSEKHTQRLG